MPEEKNWWAPVWRGLICDAEAAHYHRMKMAIWLYLFLLLHADRNTGQLLRKTSTICRETGLSRDCIQRWLKILRDQEYISTRNRGRHLEIQVTNWKSTGAGNIRQQVPEKSSTRCRIYPAGRGGPKSLKTLILQRKNESGRDPKESIIKRGR